MHRFLCFAGVLELNPHERRETNVQRQLIGFHNQDKVLAAWYEPNF